jgi:hypothetical protein
MINDCRLLWNVNAPGASPWCGVWILSECGGDFSTASEADAAAGADDTILVMPGLYDEGVAFVVTSRAAWLGHGYAEQNATSGKPEIAAITIAVENRAAFINMYLNGNVQITPTGNRGYFQHCYIGGSLSGGGSSLTIVLNDTHIYGDLDCSGASSGTIYVINSRIDGDVDHGGAELIWLSSAHGGALTGTGARTFLDAPSTGAWLIGDGPGAHFTTIAEAHNHASVNGGDVLLVYPGTYDGFTCTKALSIIGLGVAADPTVSFGLVTISGLTTQLNIQAETAWKNIVFSEDDVAVNTYYKVTFEKCYIEYSIASGAYDVDLEIKDSTLYGVDCSAATGDEMRIYDCRGKAGIGAFEVAHGAADLYLDDSEIDESLLSGTGERYTIPDVHVEKTSATASPVEVMNWRADSTATPAAGFGVRHKFSLESGSGEGEDAAAIDVVWEDAGAGTEDSAIVDYIRISGAALTEARRLNEKGVVLPTGFDFYPDGNEAGVQERLDGWNDWDEHFDVSSLPSGWSWAADAAGDFTAGAPAVVDFSEDSLFKFGGSSSTAAFCYRSLVASWIEKTFIAQLCHQALPSSQVGIRLDDSSDPANHYVEIYLDWVTGSGVRVIGRYNDGGGATSTTLLTCQPPQMFLRVRMKTHTAVGNWGISANLGVIGGYQAGYATGLGAGKTWTPDRVGVFIRSTTEGNRYCIVDACAGTLCSW